MSGTRDEMRRTGKCPLCAHATDEHRYQCEHIDRWLGLHKAEHRKCDCHMSGPEGWLAGALWNSYMGRTDA